MRRDIAALLADAVVGTTDSPVEKTLSVVGRFFRNCRPTMTPQSDGLPEFSFDVVPAEAEATLRRRF